MFSRQTQTDYQAYVVIPPTLQASFFLSLAPMAGKLRSIKPLLDSLKRSVRESESGICEMNRSDPGKEVDSSCPLAAGGKTEAQEEM